MSSNYMTSTAENANKLAYDNLFVYTGNIYDQVSMTEDLPHSKYELLIDTTMFLT
jgi:hypothetical protein